MIFLEGLKVNVEIDLADWVILDVSQIESFEPIEIAFQDQSIICTEFATKSGDYIVILVDYEDVKRFIIEQTGSSVLRIKNKKDDSKRDRRGTRANRVAPVDRKVRGAGDGGNKT